MESWAFPPFLCKQAQPRYLSTTYLSLTPHSSSKQSLHIHHEEREEIERLLHVTKCAVCLSVCLVAVTLTTCCCCCCRHTHVYICIQTHTPELSRASSGSMRASFAGLVILLFVKDAEGQTNSRNDWDSKHLKRLGTCADTHTQAHAQAHTYTQADTYKRTGMHYLRA